MNEQFQLDTIANGALKERFAVEIKKVLENILDPNTDPSAMRKISINIGIKPNKKRNTAEIQISLQSSLAKYASVETSASIFQSEGEIVVQEHFTGQLPGQISIDETHKQADQSVTSNTIDLLGYKKG